MKTTAKSVLQYLKDRIERKLGVKDVEVSDRKGHGGWKASCPWHFSGGTVGTLTLQGETPIEALEALEDQLQKMKETT